jgi:hypothetical protein
MQKRESSSKLKTLRNRRDFIKIGAISGSLMLIPRLLSGVSLITENPPDDRIKPGCEIADPLADLGCFDITKAPYFADPTGKTDSTQALQKAVNDGRDKGLVCYFPEGTYIVSDTISCEQKVEKLAEPKHVDGGTEHYWPVKRTPIVLIGSTRGKRPVIRLSKDAKGFDDPANPKKVMWIWAQTWFDAPGKEEPIWGLEQPNISFGHIVRGIDFDIRGHAGAIGLRHTGSQGSYLMDSKVYAEGAYAGFNNCPGQGGGTYNIEVEGGKYGLLADPMCRFPMVAASIFKGQSVAPVSNNSNNLPMVLVGCNLESASQVAVDLTPTKYITGLSLVDCVISVKEGGSAVGVKETGNVFMENVFIKGADWLQTNETKVTYSSGWTKILRYSSCAASAQNLINGAISSKTFVSLENSSTTPPYEIFHSRHWSRIPSFEDKDAVNVKDLGAVGDGTTDDTNAFKKAIATSQKVFVPKGSFKITEPLVLGPKTQLFALRSANIDAPLITTVDDPHATTGIFFISSRGPIEWRAGKGVCAFIRGPKVSGNGGGRFYAPGGLQIEEGTKQHIYLYAFNVERRRTNPQFLIKSAENVSIFYFKSEASIVGFGVGVAENTGNTPMAIVNSKNVRVYSVCGNITTAEKRPVMQIVNSENIMITQIKSFRTGDFPQVSETHGNETFEIPTSKTVALFLRE